MTVTAKFDSDKVSITWDDGITSKYDNIWLRDTCQCEKHFHPLTKQRLQNTFEIPEDVQAKDVKVVEDTVEVTWGYDEHVSSYPLAWLKLHSYDPVLVKEKTATIERILWAPKDMESGLPTVDYNKVMTSDDAVAEWTKKIYVHGFCMIDNVPQNPKDTEKLIERMTYIHHTHYGGFWDFTADLAMNDTAYTNLYLGSHTDGTYWSNTPGLQLFHLLHHDGKGGETMLTDGFKSAQVFKEKYPEYYELLSKTLVPAHSAGEETVCITPTSPQPIFTHDLRNKDELVQVRWNNDDRSTMDQWEDPKDVVKFYKAIRLWKKTLDEHEIVVKLVPGKCVIFDNWRVLHGRMGFDGSRRMCGAYVNRDDFISRLRLLNLGREEVLRSL